MKQHSSKGTWARCMKTTIPLLIICSLVVVILFTYNSAAVNKNMDILIVKKTSAFFGNRTDPTELNSERSKPQPRAVRIPDGTAPAAEIEEQVFNRFGYTVERWEGQFAVLHRQMQCSQVFEQWQTIARTYDPERKPPRHISPRQLAAYTLNGYASVHQRYLMDVSNPGKPFDWNKEYVDGFINNTDVAKSAYQEQGCAVQTATAYHSIKGKRGLVIGSLTPWVEAICLKNGAASVVTSDYQRIVSTHPRISYVHVTEMANDWEKYHEQFDFIVSFSSIEHSGLGRYGDPSDPIGDLRETDKMKCFLKKGGLLFVGLPVASDAVSFNAHRVYGRIRLSMVFQGFQVLDMFGGTDSSPTQMSDRIFDSDDLNASFQPVFVLRRK